MSRKGLWALSVASISLIAKAAAAQETVSQASDQRADAQVEEGEIVVTAQKRSERLIDVPMSISAASGEDLARAGISSTGDLQQITPGLVTINNGLAFTPAVRGVSSVGTSPGDETNVSLYLDDVYLGAPLAGLFDLKDIERVEVLKGPQGTLFGRNATGGAVRIVTLAPSFDSRAEFSADYGFEFNRLKLGGYVTGGLSDTIAASLNLAYINDDGFVVGVGPVNEGRRYADVESFTARGKLRFEPSATFRATLIADYSHRDDDGVFVFVPKNRRNLYESQPGVVLPNPFEYSGSTQPIVRVESGGVSLDVNWDPSEDVAVRSITAYRDARGLYQTDTERTNLSFGALRLRQEQKTFSEELNFSGPGDRTLSWIAGLYYYHSKAGNPYFSSYATDAPGGPLTASFTDEVKTDSIAGFGELTYNVTPDLHLTAGGRYTIETKHLEFADLVRAAGLRTAEDKTTWRSPTFRGVARYDFAPDANVYVSVSNGFKSGVYNAYALPAIPVEPEKITAYEIGAKGRVAGLTLSLAAFNYNYRNIQVQGQTLLNGAWVVTLANAARARIRGFEATASGNIGSKLSFDLGFSALPTARYKEFTLAQVFVPNPATGGAANVVPYDASGSRVIRSPEFQANARLTYSDVLFNGDFNASVSYSYNDGFYWQPGNFSPEDSYNVVNAKLAWTEPSGRYTFSLWGENLTDAVYSVNTSSTGVGIVDAYARPREFGVGIAAKF